MADRTLVLLPSLGAVRQSDGSIVVTRKFVDGVAELRAHWDGRLRLVMEPLDLAGGNLDNVALRPEAIASEVVIGTFDAKTLRSAVRGATVAMGGIGFRLNVLADICREERVACVYVSEYSLPTRLAMVRARTRNPLLRLRRYVWEINDERRSRRAIRRAGGIQCNGTPTYDAYRGLSPDPILFFDTRIRRAMAISEEDLSARLATRPAKLRLAFSGRLDPIKGVRFLPIMAAHLRDRGVDFDLSICGDGTEKDALVRAIADLGLENVVRMRGILGFETELVPFLKREVDLFVVPHVQGDPSCTYLETLTCGVPIVAFDNEAFHGIVARGDVGTAVPLEDARALAGAVAGLATDPDALARMSRAARAFAIPHTFEDTFRARMDQVTRVADRVRP